jgi:hypothetical protein
MPRRASPPRAVWMLKKRVKVLDPKTGSPREHGYRVAYNASLS